MKTKSNLLQSGLWSGVVGIFGLCFPGQAQAGSTLPIVGSPPSKLAEAIPWSQVGARAGANYTGEQDRL